jgi:hypothetical protein
MKNPYWMPSQAGTATTSTQGGRVAAGVLPGEADARGREQQDQPCAATDELLGALRLPVAITLGETRQMAAARRQLFTWRPAGALN